MRYSECGKGWDKILAPLIKEAEKRGIPIAQVKEKFGGLRFYTNKHDPEFEKLIEIAEKECATTCDVCGKKGTGIVSRNGWLTTRCDECEAKRVR